MKPIHLAALGCTTALAVVTTLAGPSAAWAEDRGAWFKSLRQNGSGASCCDISDCKRTKSRWRDGGWWSVLEGVETPIPPGTILHNKVSIDGEAYTCFAPGSRRVYCFVPPAPGS